MEDLAAAAGTGSLSMELLEGLIRPTGLPSHQMVATLLLLVFLQDLMDYLS